MGLMNSGQKGGAQIIQLFGRGVRLKGYDTSLKRSGKTQLPDGISDPDTSAYWRPSASSAFTPTTWRSSGTSSTRKGSHQRRSHRESVAGSREPWKTDAQDDSPQEDDQRVSTEFGDAFRKLAPVPTVAPPDPTGDPGTVYLQNNQVRLNWYPKVQAMKSSGLVGGDADAAPNETHLRARHVAFLDYDRLYFELERFKAERGWYNLNLTRPAIEALLADQSWYRLQIPPEELIGIHYEKVRLWEEIALALLKKYTERYYTFRKPRVELPHLEYRTLEDDDPNLLGVKESPDDEGYYRILIDRSQVETVAKLEELRAGHPEGRVETLGISGNEGHLVRKSPVPAVA